MKRVTIIGALALGLLAAGCEEEKTPAATEPTATAAAAGDEKKEAKGDADAKKDDEKKEASGAATHLSSDCKIVAVVDIAGMLAEQSMKAHVSPALSKISTGEVKDEQAKRLQGFLKDAEIEPEKDLKELALCALAFEGDKPGQPPPFYVVFGGDIDQGKVVPAMLKNKNPTHKFEEKELGGVKVLVREGEDMVFGQAEDGSIVVATSQAAFEKGVKSSDASQKTFELPTDKTISTVIPAGAISGLAEQVDQRNPFKDHLTKMGRAVSTFDVGSSTSETRVEMSDEKSAIELGGVLKTILKEATGRPPRAGDPMAMILPMLEKAKIDNEGKTLIVSVELPKEMFENVAKEMSKGIESGLQ